MVAGNVYRVGRDPDNDIVIDHGSISRHHCELRELDDGAIMLSDLGSMNGTSVRENGQWKPIEQASVELNERILLGEVVTTMAALMQRAPKTAAPNHPGALRPLAAPTSPARSERSGLFKRVIKSDWARLNRPRGATGSGGIMRNEPSLCLPAVPASESARPAGDGVPDLVLPTGTAASGETAAGARPVPLAAPEVPSWLVRSTRAPLARLRRGLPPLPSLLASRPRWAIAAALLMVSTGLALAAMIERGNFSFAGKWLERADTAKSGRGESADRGALDKAPSPRFVARRNGETRPAEPKTEALRAPARAKPWHRTLEGSAGSVLSAAAPAKDGGFCLAGMVRLPAGGAEAWVIRMDSQGRPLWQRRPGGPRRDAALAVASAENGGCVAAGYDNDETRLWIFNLDSKGAQVWSKPIALGHSGRAAAIVTTRDGGYAVAAYAKAAAAQPERAFVLRLNEAGAVRWSKYASQGESVASDIRETREGDLIVAGTGRPNGQQGAGLWLARLDAEGRIQWERHVATAGPPVNARLQLAQGNELLLAAGIHSGRGSPGTAAEGLRLLRLSDRGNILWDQRIAVEPRRLAGMVLVRGGIILAGDFGDRAAKPELWIAQFDARGRPMGENRHALAPGDRPASLAELKDGRLLLAGTVELDTPSQRGAGLIFIGRDRQLLP